MISMMAEVSELFINNLLKIVDNKILCSGWSRSEEDLRLLLAKQKHVERFVTAFNAAILRTFCDFIKEILIDYKISEKWDKSYKKPSNINVLLWCHNDYMKKTRIETKLHHKQCLQCIITTEMQKILLVKKRLKLLISRTLDKKNELNGLQMKDKTVCTFVEKNYVLQQIISSDFIKI